MKSPLVAIAAMALCTRPALAQEGSYQDAIVVTASYIDESGGDRFDKPAVTLKLPADHVLFELSLTTGSLNAAERLEELGDTLASARRAAGRDDTIELAAGDAERFADLDSAKLNEIVRSYGERSSIALLAKVELQDDDGFLEVRRRVDEMVERVEEAGRTQVRIFDEQYLSLDNPNQYRGDLLRLIGEDFAQIQESFPGQALGAGIDGLDRPMVFRPSGPLQLELFIPYTMDLDVYPVEE